MNLKEKILFCLYFTFISLTISFAQADGWEIQESGTNAYLKDVFFINADTGWVAGNGIIMNTTDGGENWTVQFSPPSVVFIIILVPVTQPVSALIKKTSVR